MFPPRFAPVLFGFILSGLMSLMVSGIATARATGIGADFIYLWLVGGWLPSFALSFPAVLLVGPVARRVVAALTRA
ncbi:MAG: DUF2798 domain-containing protein [Gemmobacter sp.]|nr:DUF2798 domain-containing protein [Gemmobacter sp.]